MVQERYCSACGKHVQCRQERRALPDSAGSSLRLFCPKCGKLLGSVYNEELQIERTFPPPHG
jgi:hypothetical protein